MVFMFKVGKDNIDKMRNDIEMLYLNSTINNIPPYDLYSPMLKIEEAIVDGKKILKFNSPSPFEPLANKSEISGAVIEVDGKYYLESVDGYRVDVEKREDGFYTQGYSCLTSATHVLKKYFNIDLNYSDFPPGILKHLPEDLQKAIMGGRVGDGVSPDIVMKYYDVEK